MTKEIKTLQRIKKLVTQQEISDTDRPEAIELRKLAMSIFSTLTDKLRTPEKTEAIKEQRRRQLAVNNQKTLYVYQNQDGESVYCTYADILADPELKKHAKRVKRDSVAQAEAVAEAGGWA